MAADIRIQLASEHPLTQLRTLDMESSPCPVSLSIHPSDGRDPREWILKLKEQKPIYPPGIASIWLCVCLSGKWKVILITLLSLCLLEGLSASLAGRLALCPAAAALLAHAWPSLLLPLPSSLWNLPDCFSYLGSQGVDQQNEKQPVNWVLTNASLVSFCHRGGRTRGKGGFGGVLLIFENKLIF